MSTAKLTRSASFVILVLGCTGLDPDAFGPRGKASGPPESAGWSFDAGLAPDAGGRVGASAPRGGTGEPARGGGKSIGEGGDPGEAGGGDAEPTTNGGGGGAAGMLGTGGIAGERVSVGGLGGSRSGAGGGGRSGAGSGGRAQGGAPGAGRAGGGAGGAASGAGATVHALSFSEYVEGSSSYKALEILASEASTLAGCRLVTYFNGSASGSGIALDGALAQGAVTTLCSTALAALLGAPCARATNLTFNGDDAVALECDGALLDVIGQIGVDPGDAWGEASASTLNQTLRRRCGTATDANGSDAFVPSRDWVALPSDTFEGLGVAECPPE
jgi:hypothetical protein